MIDKLSYDEAQYVLIKQPHDGETWPLAYKTFVMINSKDMEFTLLINVKMPTTFISRLNE